MAQVAPILFYAFALLTAYGAWAVVFSQNIIRMAVYLLITLAGVAGLYFSLNAELLAAIQLIVYAGGTLILIIFGVMLTSKNPFMQLKVKSWEMFLGAAVGVFIAGMLLWAMVLTTLPKLEGETPSPVQDYGQVQAVGRGLMTTYLVPFEVAAVLLLVVMIGAAFMARKREPTSQG